MRPPRKSTPHLYRTLTVAVRGGRLGGSQNQDDGEQDESTILQHVARRITAIELERTEEQRARTGPVHRRWGTEKNWCRRMMDPWSSSSARCYVNFSLETYYIFVLFATSETMGVSAVQLWRGQPKTIDWHVFVVGGFDWPIFMSHHSHHWPISRCRFGFLPVKVKFQSAARTTRRQLLWPVLGCKQCICND